MILPIIPPVLGAPPPPGLSMKHAGRQAGPVFSGTIGRNDLENILPDWWLRRKKRNDEPARLFKAVQRRFQRSVQGMADRGLSPETVAAMNAFTCRTLGLPAGITLDMPEKDFLEALEARPASEREQLLYAVERYHTFNVDHFAALFDAVETDADWETVSWILQGLESHPLNRQLSLTTQPLGLVPKPLAQHMEARSPYWHAIQQVVNHFDGLLKAAFQTEETVLIEKGRNGRYVPVGGRAPSAADAAHACETERARFVQETLYPLIRELPVPEGNNPAVAEFVAQSLPGILERFRQNHPPPKAILEAGGGHPDYFGKLQPNLMNNVMLLLIQAERLAKPQYTGHAPHGPQPMEVINHTPFNHLLRRETGEEH